MCEHKFVYLRQRTEEKSWHNWVTIDVYYCEKCLTYKEIEIEKQEPKRW
jgi:C4-type Zn-finger protein